MNSSRQTATRRQFLGATGLTVASGLLGFPSLLRAASPNEKLNLAIIGCGGRGAGNLGEVSSENIVALCDVNERNLEAAAKKFPQARKFTDFRKLYDQAGDIDAVVVSCAEHTHAFATLPALKLGKHVYCEKPLTHSV
jgi:predicted dehydrogenase